MHKYQQNFLLLDSQEYVVKDKTELWTDETNINFFMIALKIWNFYIFCSLLKFVWLNIFLFLTLTSIDCNFGSQNHR